MGARIKQGTQFRNLHKSEIEVIVQEVCLSPDDEAIVRAHYIQNTETEDIAADISYGRATVSQRLGRIDTDLHRSFATGIAGFSHVIDSLSAIRYAKLHVIRDAEGITSDFSV